MEKFTVRRTKGQRLTGGFLSFVASLFVVLSIVVLAGTTCGVMESLPDFDWIWLLAWALAFLGVLFFRVMKDFAGYLTGKGLVVKVSEAALWHRLKQLMGESLLVQGFCLFAILAYTEWNAKRILGILIGVLLVLLSAIWLARLLKNEVNI